MKLIRFFAFFLILYLIFTACFNFWISASAEHGRFYMPFVSNFFNFPSMLRHVLLNTSAFFVQLFGYETAVDEYNLRIVGGSSVRMVYTCIGYGYLSFWLAAVIPFQSRFNKKVLVLFIGVTLIFMLNIIRISGLVILSTEGETGLFKYVDHHTILDILVYPLLILVFLLCFRPFRTN